ncbi:MAG: ribose 5-phosphate isomerase B [Candidatus Omnitrophota bacterium]|nr:MAG: ribose 5-phosphate isomerase B [Candidatus Omnitrophota bacterium]
MKVGIGSDHRGFKLKQALIAYLEEKEYSVIDFGTYSEQSCDYPEFAFKVAHAVENKEIVRGILICNTGIGMSMSANKKKAVRAANCFSHELARYSREHNDANVLILGAGYIKEEMARQIVDIWFNTEFEGGRHLRRLEMFSEYT